MKTQEECEKLNLQQVLNELDKHSNPSTSRELAYINFLRCRLRVLIPGWRLSNPGLTLLAELSKCGDVSFLDYVKLYITHKE